MAAGDKKVKKSVSKSVKKNKVGGSDYTKVTKKLNKRGGVKKTKTELVRSYKGGGASKKTTIQKSNRVNPKTVIKTKRYKSAASKARRR